MYVYIKSEPSLWTVGFYLPDGGWHADSDWSTPKEAAAQVHYLNGGNNETTSRLGQTAPLLADAPRTLLSALAAYDAALAQFTTPAPERKLQSQEAT